MLLLPPELRELIRRHAAETHPHECCGILLGQLTSSNNADILLHQAIPAPNAAPPATHHNRYLIDPLAILNADKTARANNFDIVGFYHSHPDHLAVPSQTDLSQAWPDYIYLIAAITAAGVADVRAWRLTPENTMHEIPIQCPP